MEELRKEAEALGIDVDGRWSEKRLKKEIEAAKEAEEKFNELQESVQATVDNAEGAQEGNVMGVLDREFGDVTVRNTRGNLLDLKCVEIAGFAECDLSAEQMADKRVQRAIETGVLVEV